MKKYIISQIDMKNMIEKFNELEKMKLMMLTEDQINALEILDNPPSYYVHFTGNNRSIWKAKKSNIEDEMKFIENNFIDLKTKIETNQANQLERNMLNLFEFVYDTK
jgi:hypothetical protein